MASPQSSNLFKRRRINGAVSYLPPAHTGFDARYHFVEHHLARQPAMHRLGGVEPSGLEQLVRRRSAAAPAKVAAAAFARLYAAPDFAADGTE